MKKYTDWEYEIRKCGKCGNTQPVKLYHWVDMCFLFLQINRRWIRCRRCNSFTK